jgi:hypothetical protein
MKRLLTSFVLLLCLVSLQALAQIPEIITYQAQIVNSNGVIIPDGNYEMTFKLYNSETGGTALWTETQTLGVANGVVDVHLGFTNQLNIDFSQMLWLGITIEQGGELNPRTILTSSPFSFISQNVVDGAIDSDKLAEHAVTTDKIAPGSVAGDKLAENSVESHNIVNGSIEGEDISQMGASEGQVLTWLNGWFPANPPELIEEDPHFHASPASSFTLEDKEHWDMAYQWGDHAIAGYLSTATPAGGDLEGNYPDPYIRQGAINSDKIEDASIQGIDIADMGAAQGQVLMYNAGTWSPGNAGAGAESDPIYSASPSSSITEDNINNWNTAYNWGDHAAANYIADGDAAGGDLDGNYPGPFIRDDAINSDKIADDAVLGEHIAQMGASVTQVLKWNGSQWAPGNDFGGSSVGDDWGTQVVETDQTLDGTGVVGGELKIAQQGASDSQVLKWNGTSWSPSDESDPSYTASPSSSISGTEINNWNTAYSWGDHAAQNYMVNGDPAGGYLTGNYPNPEIADGAISGESLSQMGATDGQVLMWNAGTWTPADVSLGAETDPVYTASPSSSITENNINNWNTAYSWGDHAAQNYMVNGDPAGGYLTGNYPNPEIADGAISGESLSQMGATDGQVLMWNAGTWTPADISLGAETDPVYTASPSSSITENNINNWNTAYSWGDHALEGYISTTTLAGGDLTGTYPDPEIAVGAVDGDKIAQMGATDGQVLKWTGTEWEPQNDIGGGSGDDWGTQVVETDQTLDGSGVTGDELTIAHQGATDGQVLIWNTGSWAPADISLGAESDPVYTASPSSSITENNINNWNTAYGWGDHALEGYISTTTLAGGDLTGTYPDPEIADGAINSDMITTGSVVKSINTLHDDVSIEAGNNVSINTSGTTITINASISGTGGNTLDQAYDQGGAGAGREIIADNGAVYISGSDGLNVDGKILTGTTETDGQVNVGAGAINSYWEHESDGTPSIFVNNQNTGSNIGISNETWGIYSMLGSDGTDAKTAIAGSSYGDNGTKYGVAGSSWGSSENCGVYGSGAGGVYNYGVFGETGTTNNNYGVFGRADGVGAAQNIGVYGKAANGTINWAGYFEDDVYIANSLGIGVSNPLQTLDISGAIRIGNTTEDEEGTIRWDGTNFQGYNGSSWVNLDQSGGGSGYWSLSGSELSPSSDYFIFNDWSHTDNGTANLDIRNENGTTSNDPGTTGTKAIFASASSDGSDYKYAVSAVASGSGGDKIAIDAIAYGSGTSKAVNATISGSGDEGYGVYSNVYGINNTNYGVYSTAVGATTNWSGYFDDGNFYVKGNAGFGTTDVSNGQVNIEGGRLYVDYQNPADADGACYILNHNSSGVITPLADNTWGLFCLATSDGSEAKTAIEGFAEGSQGYKTGVSGHSVGIGTNYGVHGTAASGSLNYGVFGYAYYGTTNYGIYGRANGGTTNWSGYFDDGEFYVKGKAGFGTTTLDAQLNVDGGIKLGSSTVTSDGVIRWDGTNFQGYKNSSWVNLDQSSGGSGYWSVSGSELSPSSDYYILNEFVHTGDNRASIEVRNLSGSQTYYDLSYGTIGVSSHVYADDANPKVGFDTQVSGSQGDCIGYGAYAHGSGDNYGAKLGASAGTNNYGGFFMADEGTYNTAVHAQASSQTGSNTNIGVFSTASGATTNWSGFFDDGNFYVKGKAGFGTTDVSGGQLNVVGGAIYHRWDHNISGEASLYLFNEQATGGSYPVTGIYGIWNSVANNGTDSKVGIMSIANGSQGNCFGVVGEAGGFAGNYGLIGSSENGTVNYGVQGFASGTGTCTNYAIYGDAANGTTNWSGYFDDGNFYVKGNAGFGTTTLEAQLNVDGGIKLGSSTVTSDGVIRWNGTNFQGYKNSGWVDLDASGSGSGYWNLSGNTIYTSSAYGIARNGATLNGSNTSTHVNLGGNSTTGGSSFNGSYVGVLSGSSNSVDGNYSVIAGGSGNSISNEYAAIGGGQSNSVSGTNAYVGGGYNNNVSNNQSSICGGSGNSVSSEYSGIGSGQSNSVSGSDSYIGGGVSNTNSSEGSFIGGGAYNSVSGIYAVINGGYSNEINGAYSIIGGGNNNYILTPRSGVLSGSSNTVTGTEAIVAGGYNNTSSGNGSVVVGGYGNRATANSSFIGGGDDNQAVQFWSTIVGGEQNVTQSRHSFIGGGYSNHIALSSNGSVIAGGGYSGSGIGAEGNYISGYLNFIGGGEDNRIDGNRSAVVVGYMNTVTGNYSNILGGDRNIISDNYSVITGGDRNIVSGSNSGVLSGYSNIVSDDYSSVMSGSHNIISDTYSSIISGFQCTISGELSFIGAGQNNNIAGSFSTIPGGSYLKIGDRSFGYRGGIGSSPSTTTDVSGEDETFHIVDTKFFFNYNNADADFRVDGTNDNLLYCDAGENQVTIGSNFTKHELNVNGQIQVGDNSTWSTGEDNTIYFGDDSYVYIGERADDDRLDLRANDGFNFTFNNGGIGINRTASTNDLEVEGTASKSTAGDWAANSDRRIKTEITDINDSYDLMLKLRPVKFKYTNWYLSQHPKITDKFYYNFIAQEYAEVFPESVKGSGEYLESGEEILQMDSYNAQIVTIKAVQELIKENEVLKQDNQNLQQEVNELKKQYQMLFKMVSSMKEKPDEPIIKTADGK